ncbi:trans-sulfuration enzyme family protein [Rhizobium laguerreae]|uniref:trans-sulfuration enzyme family protein n=1 Tax=Rhizobium laguerreae TaxID=1076926 RepID=UPI001FEE85CE|nr:aminotransferase class I/II-fold pyridoxal phosphate-dependent enzyme [Rhizobium laguerreae]
MLEKTLARLEGAEAGLVLSSGLAAFNMLALALLSEGDEMIVHRQVCTDTAALMEKTLTRAGITMVPVDLSLPANICRAVTPRTRLIYFDTPTNPLGDILDIAAIAECGRSCGLKIVVDSTFASPALQRPIEHGADIVLQSLTKYINGHGDTLGGALLGDTAIIHKLRETNLRFPEATVISPQASFLILRGVKTLALRMDRHSSAAHAIALTLETHPAVAWVRYPFLPSHPNHSIARRQMSGGSGMLAFGLRAGRDGATAMIGRLRLYSRASIWQRSAASYAIRPASPAPATCPFQEAAFATRLEMTSSAAPSTWRMPRILSKTSWRLWISAERLSCPTTRAKAGGIVCS